jgi:hypothetical protein
MKCDYVCDVGITLNKLGIQTLCLVKYTICINRKALGDWKYCDGNPQLHTCNVFTVPIAITVGTANMDRRQELLPILHQ